MNYKKKSLILSFILIITIQILLLINNRQKTTFKYFIWNIEDVSIGRLICISFFSGLLISSILNKTIHNEDYVASHLENEDEDEDESIIDSGNSISNENNKESYEMPPERDLRETQPTISVNYRVIKDNLNNELNDRNKDSKKPQYEDDWNKNDSEW